MQNRSYIFAFFALLLMAGDASLAFGQIAGQQQEQKFARLESAILLQGVKSYIAGNYEEALDDLLKARAQDPQSSVAAYYLGATLKKMQRYKEAIPHLKDAVSIQPQVHEAYLELADVYYALQRSDEALLVIEVCEREGIEPAQTAFMKGLVLLQKRAYPPAIASFTKSKEIDPKLVFAADFQIATIYLRLGKVVDARNLFQHIADGDPESDVGHMARQQADALTSHMAQAKVFSAIVNVQYQYDSNVLLKPDNASTATGITHEADTAAVVALRAEYAPALVLPYGLKLQYTGYATSYATLKNYDVQSHTIELSPNYRLGENTVSLPIIYNDTLVDAKQYLQVVAITPTYAFMTSEFQYAQIALNLQSNDYQQAPAFPEEDRSGTDIGAVISWFRLIAEQKGYVNLKYDLTKEKTTGSNWSFLENRFGAGVLYPATDRIKLALGAEIYHQEFDNVNSIYQIKRADTAFAVNAQYFEALSSIIDGQLQYSQVTNDSNIPVYKYHKNIFAIGIYARF